MDKYNNYDEELQSNCTLSDNEYCESPDAEILDPINLNCQNIDCPNHIAKGI